MLRPATPLTVLLFAAFAMLLLAVLSTPIIKAIPLGTYKGVNFGVFGYCEADVCLLAFLIDVLLFVPHMAWGSYIVLAATILVFMSFIISCAMRRTLVNRKARKRRIAENAEMSGENYYNRQAQQEVASPTTISRQPTVPVVSGANGPSDKVAGFASFEKKDDRSSDERIPLTARTPSDRSPNHAPTDTSMTGTTYNVPQRTGSSNSMPRDQYGNPIEQAQDGYKMRRGPSFERMNARGRGGPPAGYRGRGGYGRGGYGAPYGPPGGRGGYGPPPPNGRGGYGPGRGGYGPPPNGRGGYGPRRGYGPGDMRGGRTPPPTYPGSGPYDRRPSPAGAYGDYGPGRQGSPAGAMNSYEVEPPVPSIPAGMVEGGNYQAYNPDRISDLPRAESPLRCLVLMMRMNGQ
ncbi:hypothetical protein Daesc_001455 [Daldinia eschscholtzii]|uniref:Uncharacterized protein n=1 Tax=Daldinia eschscholtzii TaxID=292717 RepID=A0AAX6MVH8_9PEZI